MSERDELIAGLRGLFESRKLCAGPGVVGQMLGNESWRIVTTGSVCAALLGASDLLERDGARIAELEAENERLLEANPSAAYALEYASLRIGLNSARAALAEAQRDAGRYRWLVNAGSENSPIARAQAVYRLWNGEDGTDGFTRALDAAISKEQSHAK